MVWLFRRIDAYLPWSPTSIIAVGRKKAVAGNSTPRVSKAKAN